MSAIGHTMKQEEEERDIIVNDEDNYQESGDNANAGPAMLDCSSSTNGSTSPPSGNNNTLKPKVSGCTV